MSKPIDMAAILKEERSAADLAGYFQGSEDYRRYKKARKRTDKATKRLLAALEQCWVAAEAIDTDTTEALQDDLARTIWDITAPFRQTQHALIVGKDDK